MSSIEICHGPRCSDYGGKALLTELQSLGVHASSGECRSLCPYSPVVHMNKKFIPRATASEIIERL